MTRMRPALARSTRFERSGGIWTQQAKLVAGDRAANDNLSGLALSGDTAMLGAQQDDDNGFDSGSVYVFTRSGGVWAEQAKLTASDGAASDSFGANIALSGDTALISAHGDDDNGSASGSVYVFTQTGGVWSEQTKLAAADWSLAGDFGRQVAISNDTVLIGNGYHGDFGTRSGAAYFFDLDLDDDGLSNTLEANLGTAPDDPDSDDDGLTDYADVSLDGDASNYTVGGDADPNDPDTDDDGLSSHRRPLALGLVTPHFDPCLISGRWHKPR